MNARAILLTGALVATAVPGQNIADLIRSGRNQAPRQQDPDPNDPYAPQGAAPGRPLYREGFQGLESVYPQFPGFPGYPEGYGPQPISPADRLLDTGLEEWRPVPFAPSATPQWPSWIGGEAPGLQVATPERGVLARVADRVWFLAPGETAFIPLAFFDKFRVVDSGSVIEVRNKGEFQMAFHDGGTLRSIGPVRLHVVQLSEQRANLELDTVRRLWLTATARPFRVALPDGSALELPKGQIYFERDGGRAFVHNSGSEPVTWVGRVGRVDLPPAHRLDVFLDRPTRPVVSPWLQLDGAVRVAHTGRAIEVRADGEDGAVSWSGARFRVPAGGVVRIDPLAGDRFPEKKQ